MAQVHGQDEQRGQLAGKGLGGGHADLRSGVRIDRAGRLAGDHGAHRIADGQGLGAFLFGLALRRQRVGGFAGLRNHDGQRVRPHDGVAVAEFAAVVHLHRNARQLLDHELAGQPGVPAGAAGDDLHLADAREFGRRDIHFIQEDAAALLRHAAQRGVAHGARLLIDFLEHEMLVAALFRQDGVPQDVLALAVHRAAFEVGEPDAVGVSTTMSPSARKIMSCVWVRIAGTSEATKYSPAPMPTTSGAW